MKKFLMFGVIILFSLSVFSQDKPNWISLFNGKNLDGFHQLGGKAIYKVKKGELIGKSVAETPNSFLTTNEVYGDFILEFELKVDTVLNSGVQIRSHSKQEYQNGRVHGYQVEIDPSTRAWSGGIYDEGRRGWLYNAINNPSSKVAFKNNTWNQYRIEAIGNNIKTWINGIAVADLIDEMDASGFISFQVHAIDIKKKPWTLNTEVHWKNIRILTENLSAYTTKLPSTIPQVTTIPNTLSASEIKDGWKLMFDGKTNWGWRGVNLDKFPNNGWEINKGELSVVASTGGEATNGGDIVTFDEYDNFEFSLEFKITEGANSGIKYFVTEKDKTVGSAIGLEFQILDDARHPDAKLGRDGNRTIGSLYDLITANPSKKVKAIGEWNKAKIVSYGNNIEHWLNGELIVKYVRGSKEYRDLVAISKYKVWPNFGEACKGHILLQDHGNRVSYRNIKLREL